MTSSEGFLKAGSCACVPALLLLTEVADTTPQLLRWQLWVGLEGKEDSTLQTAQTKPVSHY